MRSGAVLAALCCAALASTLALPAAATAASAPRCAGRPATIVGGNAGEVITGTAGRDVIVGGGGADQIDGRGGDDLICGGRGNDRLRGGPGDDVLLGGLGRLLHTDEGSELIGDRLDGGPGDDRLVPGHDPRTADDVTPDVLTWDRAPRGIRVDLARGVARGWGTDRFTSAGTVVETTPYADVVLGSPRTDRILTGDGNDLVRARAGDDQVVVDPSGRPRHGRADRAWSGPGDDALTSEAGADVLRGNAGDDSVGAFGGGDDVLLGQAGDDLVVGLLTGPAQRFSGGDGSTDRLVVLSPAGSAPDSVSWDMATRSVTWLTGPASTTAGLGGFEDVDLSTFTTPWEVWGTAGPDRVSGAGTPRTTFHGRGGDDSFLGSAGDDVFEGDGGTDRSLGMGIGTDTCVSVEVIDVADCEVVTP